MTDGPVIRFAGVGQRFHGATGEAILALDDLSFDIGRHEFVAVLGPSGCGKSTLLRLTAGLIGSTVGRVEIFGQPVIEPRDEIGIVFQKPTLLPWCDVLGNVTFPMRHKYGRVTDGERKRAKHLLDLVGLADFARRSPGELSGGMQQRVAIARALLLDPDILLMDEPFSALDALTRDEMAFELLRIWTDQPKTVLFITHAITEALLLADRIIVMTGRPGRVREIIDVPLQRPAPWPPCRTRSSLNLPITFARASSAASLRPDQMAGSAGRGRPSRTRLAALKDRLAPPAAFVALLIFWEVACRLFAVPSFLLPMPSAIAHAFVATPLAVWGGHIYATLRVVIMGYVLAVLVSVPLAIGITQSRFLARTLYPMLIVVQSTPIVAIAPIIIVTLGASDLPRVVITFLITFFPILVSTVTGLQSTPEELIELSRSLRAGRAREILQVRIPCAVPHLFAALKVSTTLAVIGAVVAEFVAAEKGLGFFIAFSTSMFKLPTAFAGLVALVAISLILFRLVGMLQR